MHNFKELRVWQKSMDLATDVYRMTNHFPKEEKFGLSSQMRRAAVSISSNIAEGAGRKSEKEFARFLSISYASCCELETQAIIAQRVGFMEKGMLSSLQNQIAAIQKMIYKLQLSLKGNN